LQALTRSGEKVQQELAVDLTASWPGLDRPEAATQWLTRPSILRRVASRLAEAVPAETHRLVGAGPGAEVLATATSLTTGLSFAVLQPGSASPDDGNWGHCHEGEDVTVVSVSPLPADALLGALAVRRLHMVNWLVVAAATAPQGEVAPYTSLFTFDSDGVLVPGKDRRA
jgi:orotate phosphoribosyltransferase